MKKVYQLCIKTVVIISIIMFLAWLFYSVNYLTTMLGYLKFDYITFITIVTVIFCYLINKRINIYTWIFHQKKIIIAILFLYQTFIVLHTSSQAGADTTGVIESILGIKSPEYFSAFTNNYLYGLYVKVIFSVVGPNYAILVQEMINIFLINIIIIMVPKYLSLYISENSAKKSFVFLFLTLGLNPTIISTYTDYLSIFSVSVVFCISLKLLKVKLSIAELFLYGIMVSIAFQIRATSFIFVIGLVVSGVIFLLKDKPKSKILSPYKIFTLLVVMVDFIIPNLCINYAKSKQVIHYTPNQTKPLLYYLDLGLTSTGSNHFELPATVLQYGISKTEINEVIKNDLKSRLKDYNIDKALNKFKLGYEAGDFGWQAERVINDKKLVRNNITTRFINSKLGKNIQKQLFPVDKTYLRYTLILQVFYIIVVWKVVISLFNILIGRILVEKATIYMLVTVVGMFLYFALFEFGRSRYLISFWPLIITLSTLFENKVGFKRYKDSNLSNYKG